MTASLWGLFGVQLALVGMLPSFNWHTLLTGFGTGITFACAILATVRLWSEW